MIFPPSTFSYVLLLLLLSPLVNILFFLHLEKKVEGIRCDSVSRGTRTATHVAEMDDDDDEEKEEEDLKREE